MNSMNPLLKGFVIGAAVIVPLMIVLNLAEVSDGVIGPTVVLAMCICTLIALKIYADENFQ